VDEQLDPTLDLGSDFILARDRVAVAITGPHGQFFRGL
jgi:hypothetical protein